MGDGQAEAGLDPDGEPAAPPRRTAAEGTALLLAVERVGADVAALARLLSAQPEEVAARVGIDAAAAAITVRVGALDSLVDQLRLSLLAGLDRVADRLDQPLWLAELRTALGEVALAGIRDQELSQALAELAAHVERGRADQPGPAVLDAVTRLGAALRDDIAGLTRIMASQPQEVAALVDLGAATRPLTVRLDALEQLGVALLPALHHTADQLAQPAWLPALQSAMADRASTSPEDLERALAAAGERMERALEASTDPRPVLEALAVLAADRRLDRLTDLVSDLGDPLDPKRLTTDVTALLDHRLDLLATLITGLSDQVGTDRLTTTALAAVLDDRLATVVTSLRDRSGAEPPPAALTALLDDRLAQVTALITGLGDRPGTGDLTSALVTRVDQRLNRLTVLVAGLSDPPSSEALTAALAPLLDNRFDRFDDLVSHLADRPPPDHLAATVTGAVETRLDQVTAAMAVLAEGVKAGAAVADALEMVGRRLAAVEATAGQVATDSRQLAERVAPLAERVGAIAVQVDRITPLARAGDEAGSLLGALDRVSAGLDQAVAGLLRSGVGPARAGASPDGDPAGGAEAVIEALAGVSRRQDEVTAAVASVLDQVRGPMSVEAVLDRMEQRERSLAARLDRIDAELRQRPPPPGALTSAGPRQDDDTAQALRAVLTLVGQQERILTAGLDRMATSLRAVADVAVPDGGADREAASAAVLGALQDSVAQQERTVGALVERVDVGLKAAATAAAGAGDEDERGAEGARLLATLADRFEHQELAIAGLLGELGEQLAELAAQRAPGPASPPDADNGPEGPGPGEHPTELLGGLAEVARRQDDLAEAVSGLVDQARGPLSVEAVFDRMDQRERSLAARLDRIEHQLRSGVSTSAAGGDRPPGTPPTGTAHGGGVGAGTESLASSVDAVAAATGDLAALIESTAARLDRRLAALESGRAPAAGSPQPRPTAANEAAARRLAELREERARVQAQLQEERLLAAEAWGDE